MAYIQDLIIKPPFSELFSIDENVLQAIVKNILENTYDESQPIVVWKDQNIVIDGHTRLKASHLAGRQIISVFNKAFRNEEEALQYAINNQRNRRNMSEAELLRCIEAVDKRQERGGDRKRVRGNLTKSAKWRTKRQILRTDGQGSRCVGPQGGAGPQRHLGPGRKGSGNNWEEINQQGISGCQGKAEIEADRTNRNQRR